MFELMNFNYWIFTFVAVLPVVIYLVYLYNKNYWKLRGIKSPPSSNFFSSHLNETRKFSIPVNYVLHEWTKKYGPVYGIQEGWRKTIVISDHKMAHEMFVRKFENFHGRKMNPLLPNVDTHKSVHVFNARGSRWKRLRNISSPSFNNNNLKRIYPTVNDTCQKLMKYIDNAYYDNKAFNIHPYFHEYTMDIILRVAMGQTQSKLFDNEYVEMTKKVFLQFGGTIFEQYSLIVPAIAPLIRLIFLLYSKIKKTPVNKMINLLTNNVNERRRKKLAGETVEANTTHVDFIDLFLEAEDPNVKDGEFNKSGMKVSKNMTVDEVIRNCFVFLLAGFDTTANTLSITAWLLAKHPDIQQNVLDEIDDITNDDEEITFEKVNELRYLDAVMKEALRLYPIAAFACARECLETTTLGEYTIKKGENVNVDVLSLHFNKDIWGENAEEFIPERFFDWTSEQQMSYYPFGGGPRTCIGMRLAYLEEKLCLYYILKKYKLVATAETEKNLKMVGRTVWNPESVTIKLEKR